MVGRQIGGHRISARNDHAGSEPGDELPADQEAPVQGCSAQSKAGRHDSEGDLDRPALGPLAEPRCGEESRERHAHAIGAGGNADLDRTCRQCQRDVGHQRRQHQRLDADGGDPRHQEQEMALE